MRFSIACMLCIQIKIIWVAVGYRQTLIGLIEAKPLHGDDQLYLKGRFLMRLNSNMSLLA